EGLVRLRYEAFLCEALDDPPVQLQARRGQGGRGNLFGPDLQEEVEEVHGPIGRRETEDGRRWITFVRLPSHVYRLPAPPRPRPAEARRSRRRIPGGRGTRGRRRTRAPARGGSCRRGRWPRRRPAHPGR